MMDLEHAITAHGEWKIKLRAAMAAKGKLDAASLSRDDQCPLGKWLQGEAKAKYSGLKSYLRCVGDHSAFHREAGKVAEAINSGQYAQAERMLGNGTTYTTASTAVGVAILALRKESGM